MPVPEIAPEKINASERSKTRAALLTTLPAKDPAVAPSPTRKVPADTVVPPVCVAAPERTTVPVPACSTEPAPERLPAIVSVPVRLKTRDPLFVIAPAPSVPVAPPAPTRTVPPETIVVPT